MGKKKGKDISIRNNHARATMRRICDYLKRSGVRTNSSGLKHNELIRLYASSTGKVVSGGLKDWAIREYKAGKLPDPTPRPKKVVKVKKIKAKDRPAVFSQRLVKRATKAEKKFRLMLNNARIPHTFQKVIHNDHSFYIIDFFIPIRNICIEIDGGYHLEVIQKWKDDKRDEYLLANGYEVIRFTNEEVMDMNETKMREMLNL